MHHIRKRIGNDLDLRVNEALHVWYHVRYQFLTPGSMNFRVFSDILSCSKIDVRICLTTWQYIPEDSELQSVYRLLFRNSELLWQYQNLLPLTLSCIFLCWSLPIPEYIQITYCTLNAYRIFCKHTHFFFNYNSFNRLKQRLLWNLYCLHVYLTVNNLLL
jgi:hypothetical protein